MYLELFHKFFPDVAKAELRCIFVDEGPVIPAGAYALFGSILHGSRL